MHPLIISIVEVNFNWNSKYGHEKKNKDVNKWG